MGTITIFGKKLRTWLFVTLLIALGMGAGAAQPLLGFVQGEVATAVSPRRRNASAHGSPSGMKTYGAPSFRACFASWKP